MKHRLLLVAAFMSVNASAQDCPGGSLSIEGCRKLLIPLERQLAAAERVKEKWLREQYEQSNGTEYVAEAVKALRDSNRAWRRLRDLECWYEALKNGMSTSPDYASPVAEACKVGQTRERIKWLSQ